MYSYCVNVVYYYNCVFSLGFTPLDVVHHGLWNYFPYAD